MAPSLLPQTASPFAQIADTDELAETAINSIEHLLRTDICGVAWSGGKDSSVTLTLALCALQRVVQARATIAPLMVFHNDTEVENPSVRQLADTQLGALKEWADREDLPVSIFVSRPSLSTTFAVKVLGGKALPRYPGGSASGDCATDYKVTPATKTAREAVEALEAVLTDRLARDPADAAAADILSRLRKHKMPVILLGSRREESAARAASIAKHEQSAVTVAELRGPSPVPGVPGKLISRTFSPIVDWGLVNVWELLTSSGTDHGDYKVWQPSAGFSELNDLYKAATGSCTIIPGPAQQRRTACGARFGCWACTKTGDDKSLTQMLQDARYHHLAPLSKIRDFISDVRYDLSRRSWLGRKLDDDTTSAKIQPDTFDDATLEALVLAIMTADRDEAIRASSFTKALAGGRMPDDPFVQACLAADRPVPASYLEQMQNRQFATFDERKIVALDFTWSILGRHGRPYHALSLYDRVWHKGERHTLPSVEKTAPVPIPPARWLKLDLPPGTATGLGDPLAVWAQEACTGSAQGARLPAACGGAIAPDHIMGDEFDVDPESAAFILEFEWPNQLKSRHDSPTWSVTEGALFYLRYGAVQVSPRNQVHYHRMLRRTQALEACGLLGASPQALVARSTATAPTAPTEPSKHSQFALAFAA